MTSEFAAVMARKSNAELLEITDSTEDQYQAAALEAANAELARRKLTPGQLQSAIEVTERKHAEASEVANTPLQLHWIICTILFPGLVNILLAEALRSEGKKRKAKELTRYTLWGVALYAGLILMKVIFDAVVNIRR